MKEDIKKELEEMAPHFVSLERRNPFLVPNGYFETLSSQILPVNNQDSSIPEGYFDSLPDQVIGQAKQETKVLSIRRAVSVAAVFILGMMGLWSIMGDFNNTTTEVYALDMESELDETFDIMLLNGEYEIADLLDFVDDESIEELIFNTENDITEDPYFDDLIDELDADQLEELL